MKKNSLLLLILLMLISRCISKNVNKEVKIGEQVWMTNNLSVDKFRNGDLIYHAKTNYEWKRANDLKTPAWCYPENDSTNNLLYGKLYNWFAVNDVRGLAPNGWKIPSDEDWSLLISFLGDSIAAEKKLKFDDLWRWHEGKTGAGTNESGFSALPAGNRSYDGVFYYFGFYAGWWSSTENLNHDSNILTDEKDAWRRDLKYNNNKVHKGSSDKEKGLSVRCVKVY